MVDTALPRPVRLVGLALVAVGLVEVVGLAAGPLLTGEGRLDAGLLALPASALLLQGRTAWVRPALRLAQAVVVGLAVVSVAALLGLVAVPVTVAGGGAADLGPGLRALAAVLVLAQGALWVWALDLGGRLVTPRRPEAA